VATTGKPPHRRRGLVHKVPKKLDGPRSEINVTPLVDVCLVLLIIFMVITPLLARGKDVPLPRTQHHDTESDKNQPIVAVAADGLVYFDKDVLTEVVQVPPQVGDTGRRWTVKQPDVLRRRLLDAWARVEEQRADEQEAIGRKVFVKGARDLAYGQVYPVIMALHEAGASVIDLGTNEYKQQAASQ
jgi:biopolymer transport protein TolR